MLAILLIATARHAETFLGNRNAYLLTQLDRWGMVRGPSTAQAEFKSAGIHIITDETAVIAMLGYGVYLAIASMLAAACAEFRREENLWLGAGFMCGSGALFLANRFAGFGALFVGAAAMLFIRRARVPTMPA